ncbi:MAG: chemotaxis response regulator protein-glutamate methylesterase [Holosporales bacterium]|jgi:two-component system chemotaxis response regulator CheB
MKKIRVLIVDDSALIREIFKEILSADESIDVVGTAVDPIDAREKIKQLNPDVLTLDIEMPKMDGISFLEKIMSLRPMPVVMASSLTQKGAEMTIRALELGAFDTIAKPAHNQTRETLAVLGEELISKVKAAAIANVRRQKIDSGQYHPLSFNPSSNAQNSLIAIGASTGGVEALRDVLINLPKNTPPVVIVQHMPAQFTPSFAARLESLCTINVKEAANHDRLSPGHAYLAPGGRHLQIKKIGQDFVCKIDDGEKVSGHKPSVDVLFNSVASAAGAKAVGVIMTGMGRDGADGLLEMRNNGAYTIGQNAASCVVYGMPQAAAKLHAVTLEVPLSNIAKTILQHFENKISGGRHDS